MYLVCRLRGGDGSYLKNAALGVAPGGLIKQCILEDTNPATIWERDYAICFNVQILNSAMFQQVTGRAPPPTPISAKTYADEGLPFYKIYGETSAIKGDFDGIKSVKEIDKTKTENGKREKEDVDDVFESNKKPKDISNEENDNINDVEDNSDSDGEEDDGSDDDEEDSEADSGEDEDLDPDEDEIPMDADGDQEPFQNPVILLNAGGSAMGKFTPVSELMEELSRMKLRNS